MKTYSLTFLLFIFLIQVSGQDEWKWINPKPDGEPGRAIHFISASTGYIFKSQEILITIDGGETWGYHKTISSINAVDFNASTAYIVGDDGYMIKSEDGGMTWADVNSGVTSNLNSVTIISDDIIFTSDEDKVMKSSDGGNTWEFKPFHEGSVRQSLFTTVTSGIVTTTLGNIYRTKDGGNTWQLSYQGSYYTVSLSLFFVNSLVGYISLENDDILKTLNGGESWSVICSSPADAYSLYFLSETTGYMAGEYGFIQKTSDGGLSWEWIGFQPGYYGDSDIYSIFFLNNQEGYVTGWAGRIVKTIDGGESWESYSPMCKSISQVAFFPDSTAFALTDKLFKSEDGGETWDTIHTGVINYETYIYTYRFGQFLSPDTFFVVADCGMFSWLVRSYNGGQTCTAISVTSMTHAITSIWFLNALDGYLCVDNTDLNDGFFKTGDGGDHWTKISDFIASEMVFTDKWNGYALRYGDLYRTTDGGATWSMIYEIYGDLTQIQFVNPLVGYISGEFNTILKTTDGGTNWIKLQTEYDHLISIGFVNENIGFTSGEYGHFLQTSNGGYTWTSMNHPRGAANSICTTQGYHVYTGGTNGVILEDTITYDELSLLMESVEDPGCGSALLTGIASTNGDTIEEIGFEYGEGDLFDHFIPATPDHVITGKTMIVHGLAEELTAETDYEARLRTIYRDSVYFSAPILFSTRPDYVITPSAVEKLSASAILSTDITPCRSEMTDIVYEYDTTREYRNTLPASPSSVGNDTNLVVSATMTDPDPGVVYFFRIRGLMDTTLVYGPENSFSMAGGIILTPLEPERYSNNSILLRGLISPQGETVFQLTFKYGLTTAYGQTIYANPGYVGGASSRTVDALLTGLEQDKTYHARIEGYSDGTIYSDDFTFMLITAIPTPEKPVEIRIYPNPTGDNLFIHSELPVEQIILMNSSGYTLMKTSGIEMISLSGYPSGLYFIRICTKDGCITVKTIRK